MFSGKVSEAVSTACSILAVARAKSVPYSSSTVIIAYDDEELVVVLLTSAIVDTCCSIGTAMRSLICSAVAPAEIATTDTAGSSTCGISSWRMDESEMPPSIAATTHTSATKERFRSETCASLCMKASLLDYTNAGFIRLDVSHKAENSME